VSGVVAEFRDGANRGPARIRVAILAGYVQGAMRTTSSLPLGVRRAGKIKDQNQEREPATKLS